jgi:hypothetical protein
MLQETFVDDVSDEYLVFKQLDLLVKDPEAIYELLPKNCVGYGRLVVMIGVEPVNYVRRKKPPPKRRL